MEYHTYNLNIKVLTQVQQKVDRTQTEWERHTEKDKYRVCISHMQTHTDMYEFLVINIYVYHTTWTSGSSHKSDRQSIAWPFNTDPFSKSRISRYSSAHPASKAEIRKTCQKRPAQIKRDQQKKPHFKSSKPRHCSRASCLKKWDTKILSKETCRRQKNMQKRRFCPVEYT